MSSSRRHESCRYNGDYDLRDFGRNHYLRAALLHQDSHDTKPSPVFHVTPSSARDAWISACETAADTLTGQIPDCYRSRTFSGILGDIKALPPKQALSLYSRKKGLGIQYALQYLATGIDSGRGYQACAASALSVVLENQTVGFLKPPALDIGCAIGVLGGILGIDGITGIDLFVDLLRTAVMVDTISGRKNHYLAADMTRDWPVSRVFGTILCGLVCHHLKTQADTVRFFMNANHALSTGGSLIITLPAGTVATIEQFTALTRGIESFGFRIEPATTGLVRSADDPHSLFWMFLITATLETPPRSDIFISPSFSFPDFRTPVTRVEKGDRARLTVQEERRISHDYFRLIPLETLVSISSDLPLIYEEVNRM